MQHDPQTHFQPRRTDFRDALGRLAAYRDSIADDATISLACGLTATDIDVVLDHCAATGDVIFIPHYDMDQLPLELTR
jgi:hypothetical protein